MLRWAAVRRQGPAGPVLTLDPWKDWLPPDLHGFYAWVFDTLKVLDEFISQVASARRDAAILSWTVWLREDLSSRHYQWLRADLVPPAPYLVCDPLQTLGGSGILVQPALIDAQFRKAWMPFFRRREREPVTPHGSWRLSVVSLSRLLSLTCLCSLLKICTARFLQKKLLLVGWMGGVGMS